MRAGGLEQSRVFVGLLTQLWIDESLRMTEEKKEHSTRTELKAQATALAMQGTKEDAIGDGKKKLVARK